MTRTVAWIGLTLLTLVALAVGLPAQMRIDGGGAPLSATYITQTANGILSGEQALSGLASGIMRVATTTGVITSLTNSSGIAVNISDETGSGILVFDTDPTVTTSVNWKDSLVTTGLTTIAPTNVAWRVKVSDPTDGGMTVTAMSSVATTPLIFRAVFGSTDPPDANVAMVFRSGRRSGTDGANLADAETGYQFQKFDGTALFTMLGNGATTLVSSFTLSAAGVPQILYFGNDAEVQSEDGVPGRVLVRNASNGVGTGQIGVGSYRMDDALGVEIVFASATAPTISSGFGTNPSVVANSGSAAFTINVGTGGVASSGVVGMPTATTGWACHVEDRTAVAANTANARTVQTATTTTSVTVQNQTVSTGAALAWAASDILSFNCLGF